jgi:hypothetical protein
MADLTITAASVVSGTGAVIEAGIAGETLAAGKAVKKNSAGKWMLDDADDAPLSYGSGIALNGAALNQPVDVQTNGNITLGTGTEGVPYFVSPTAGGICPLADISTGDYVKIVGIGQDGGGGLVMINRHGGAAQVQ